jgi:hypothetical protein
MLAEIFRCRWKPQVCTGPLWRRLGDTIVFAKVLALSRLQGGVTLH